MQSLQNNDSIEAKPSTMKRDYPLCDFLSHDLYAPLFMIVCWPFFVVQGDLYTTNRPTV